MARFTIYSPTGTALYTGTPSFTGQYMKPGLLEFREVSVPTLLALEPGCYVDYDRTGYRYRIYTVPQIKKQARRATYGGAFVFQGVQLYDASKQLEYCPFRDLVKGDNRIHFSTQPSISTFEGVDGLARRFEACLCDQYDVNGVQSWAVRVATVADDGISQETANLMAEAREFTVSGLNILECLDKIYEIWPGIGWIYKVENSVDTIVIGGGGASSNVGNYSYGKGNGLTSLTRVAANADEIANRIFAYGSSRNMLPRWYNNQSIKNAASVDIQNLMIPVSSWGLTDNLPDPAKAFIEDATSIAKNGLRPATVYFDGSGEYPEIYPTLRGATIGAVRTALGSSSAKYYPSTTVYTDATARVDALKAAQSTFDSGKAGADGKDAILSDHDDISATASGQVPAAAGLGQKMYATPFLTKDISISENGEQTISVNISLSGTITTSLGYMGTSIRFYTVANGAETLIGESIREIAADSAGTRTLSGAYASVRQTLASGSTVRVKAGFVFAKLSSSDPTAFSYSVTGQATEKVAFYRAKTFTVTLRQIGFDIDEQAALGDGKTISMRSGDCVGRSFAIISAQYQSATDDWVLECYRTEDESLSQWFPNADYKVKSGDEFVLLDIAMPDIYVQMAEQRLLTEAQGLLSDTATEMWQYSPEIDAKFMIENSRTIVAGQNMTLTDTDIIGESAVSALVDTVTIAEGEAEIPTYKVTLRDRKRKTWTESESAPSSSSKSVGTASGAQQTAQGIDLSGYVKTETFNDLSGRVSTLENESFFTLDSSGNVTLKAAYSNLWVPGWMAEGGIGSGGSGGGGVDLDRMWASLTNTISDAYANTKINAAHLPASLKNPYALTFGSKTYDGSAAKTITASDLGALTAHQAVTLASGTNNGTLKLTVGSTVTDNIAVKGLGSLAYKSSLVAADIPDISGTYLKLTGGTMAGAITMNGANILTAADSTNQIGSVTNRFGNGFFRNLYTTYFGFRDGNNGGTQWGHIGCGDGYMSLYLENGNGGVYGQYVFNSDYGFFHGGNGDVPCGRSDHRWSYVYGVNADLTGDLGIAGSITPAADITSYLGSNSRRFHSGCIVNVYTRNINFKHQTTGKTDGLIAGGDGYLRFRTGADIDTAYKDIVFHETYGFYPEQSGVNLGYGSAAQYRWANIYGVNADLSGNLALARTSTITIGPVTITYDSTNKALHIYGTDNGQTIGLYCDGWMAEGGVAQTT